VDQRTCLYGAALYGQLEIIKLLIERGASLSAVDKDGRTPFYETCSYRELETARYLFSSMRDQGIESVNQPLQNGRTPLSKAAGRGHLETVRFLLTELEVTLTVNAIETDKKRTALHWAAYGGKTDVVKLLLQNGAEAAVKDIDGNTPLAMCGQGWAKGKLGAREPIVMMLIDHDQATAASDTNLMATAAIKGST